MKILPRKLIILILISASIKLKSEVVCIDFQPDTIISNNKIYLLDLNNDGLDDYRFVHEDEASGLNGNGLGIRCLHPEAQFLGNMPPGDPTHFYPYKLTKNTLIDENADGEIWVDMHPDPEAIRVINLQYNNSTYAGGSQWLWGVVDHYLGLRVKVGEEYFYGWVKLDVSADAKEMKIKAFGFNNTPNEGIFAGEGEKQYLNPVTNLYVNDVSDYGDGRDLFISFSRAKDESLIEEYRVFVVEDKYIDSFNIEKANNLTDEFYLERTPDNSDHSFVLNEQSIDIKGNKIIENKEYVVFVLSKGNSHDNTENVLSDASSPITLTNMSSIDTEADNKNVIVIVRENELYIKSNIQGKKNISIYALDGKEVFSYLSLESTESIPLVNLRRGFYILVVKSNDKILYNNKFIK
jgi:hypothetical protein